MLTDQELTYVLQTALTGASTFHRIVSLLIFTGQRRSEIASLQWAWIDLEENLITLPKEITKNRREHRLPIGAHAVAILAGLPRFKDNPYVFPAARAMNDKTTVFNGWGKPKAALDAELEKNGCTLAPWTLHDLRRTLRTKWAELGILREVAEKYINHVSGLHSGVSAVYDRHKYIPEMRAAVALWEGHLQTLLKSGTVALSALPQISSPA